MSALRKPAPDELTRLVRSHLHLASPAREASNVIAVPYNTFRRWLSEDGISVRELRAVPAVDPKRSTDEIAKSAPWHLRIVQQEPVFKDDSDEITEAIARVAAENRPIRIHIMSDHHCGDEDVRAWALHIEITRYMQPDFNVDNGDVFDFATLSDFQQSRGIELVDAMALVAPTYRRYIEARHEASPDTVTINYPGNHERRVSRRANDAWMFADSIVRDYATLVRCNGLVLWSGWMEEIDVFNLNIQHGERTNKNAAETTVSEELGFGMSMCMGHTHRFNTVIRAQRTGNRRRYVTALNFGYAGKLRPKYRQYKKSTHWVQGSVLAHVYPQDYGIVNLEPLVYHETSAGGLVAFVGTKRIEVDKDGRRVA